MKVSLLGSILSPQHVVGDLEWPGDLLEFVEVEKKDEAPLWSPAVLGGTDRKRAPIQTITALVLDFDGKETGPHCYYHDLQGACLAFSEYEFVLHTTFSHTPAAPSFRMIFPLATDMQEWNTVAEVTYRILWQRLAADTGADPTSAEARRFYYGPSCRPGAPRLALHWPGDRRLSSADLPTIASNPPPVLRSTSSPSSFPAPSHVVTPAAGQQGTGFFPE